ncbi:DNA-directed RNA polymerase subunit L [Methanococcus voltae]|uniref:DNA-directed RNA polymerase subunit Rpo11 n=1 Tax=Methanococcus voltae TaxID=2188 RepID=A0A8J7S1E8_METVO|nr:DNA-directed RNA polymerase subunit L [Methanococcus voltae]MBP2172473.1 DNA-directed RNA polymerase subunit L [Methanococcus voltae]MBP2201620.1 DNA-directed RNA polymerase subunit L [Methanococcus voltae]
MIKIIKQTENYLEFELKNEDHSLPNILKDIMLVKENVIMASYNVEHPVLDPESGKYISNPVLVLKTAEGTSAVEILKESLSDLIKLCDDGLNDL